MIDWINDRVGLPDDSETFRAQKLLSLGMILGGSVLTLVSALTHYWAGYTLAPLNFIALGIFLIIVALVLLQRPQWFQRMAWVTLSVTVLFNISGQLLSGGLTAGTYDIVWGFVGILGAVLIMGRLTAVAMIILFALGIAGSVLVDPAASALKAQAPATARMLIGTYNLVLMGVYLAGSTLLLIGVIETLRLRADELLLNILPAPIAARLKDNPETIADGYGEISVLFADIVDFTSMSSAADPADVVGLLNDIFSEFDDLAQRHGLEKIKTIGDAYMAASGLPAPREDHAQAIVAFALDMLQVVEGYEGFHGEPVKLRIGINSGPVVAGVIGRNKFIYDLWGDAVNVASRMESNGLANQIQVTAAVQEKLDGQYEFVQREPLAIKGKGLMETYLLRQPGDARQAEGSTGAPDI